MDLKESDILGPAVKDHWYYVSKGRALRTMLGGETVDDVLDVGAGSGVFTRQLLDCGLVKHGVCVDPGYETEHVEKHNDCEISFVRNVKDVPQKLLLMMDVLEHVDDDVGLLKEYADRMPPDGRVLITVPAFQFLWSGHDVFLEHRRRYTLPHIEQVVRDAGLNVLKGRYFFGALSPVAAAVGMLEMVKQGTAKTEAKCRLKHASSIVNSTLNRLHDVERVALFSVNRLAGLTAFCLAARG